MVLYKLIVYNNIYIYNYIYIHLHLELYFQVAPILPLFGGYFQYYIYIHTYIYVYIYIYISICMCVYIYIYIYMLFFTRELWKDCDKPLDLGV